jgi:hypothetical protein
MLKRAAHRRAARCARVFIPAAFGIVLSQPLLASPAAGGAAASAQDNQAGALWDQWTRKLAAIDQQLRAGAWEPAGEAARRLADEIANASGGTMGYLRAHADELDGNHVGQGYAAEAIALGRASAYAAIAEAMTGRQEAAAWHWYAAQNLDARWVRDDLQPYGDAAPFLRQHRIKVAADQVPELDVIDPVSPEGDHRTTFRQPERTAVVYPKRPKDLADRDRFSQAIFIQITIMADGTVEQPVVVDAPLFPGMMFKALAALSQWRYNPATLAGRPVPFRFVVPVVFSDDRPPQSAVFF